MEINQRVPVLITKLFIPRPGPAVVARPRLIARLNAGLPHHLSLIAAPAGFGKTTPVRPSSSPRS